MTTDTTRLDEIRARHESTKKRFATPSMLGWQSLGPQAEADRSWLLEQLTSALAEKEKLEKALERLVEAASLANDVLFAFSGDKPDYFSRAQKSLEAERNRARSALKGDWK